MATDVDPSHPKVYQTCLYWIFQYAESHPRTTGSVGGLVSRTRLYYCYLDYLREYKVVYANHPLEIQGLSQFMAERHTAWNYWGYNVLFPGSMPSEASQVTPPQVTLATLPAASAPQPHLAIQAPPPLTFQGQTPTGQNNNSAPSQQQLFLLSAQQQVNSSLAAENAALRKQLRDAQVATQQAKVTTPKVESFTLQGLIDLWIDMLESIGMKTAKGDEMKAIMWLGWHTMSCEEVWASFIQLAAHQHNLTTQEAGSTQPDAAPSNGGAPAS